MPISPKASLGKYEILSPLGVGAMGEVYRVKDLRLVREIAIKPLRAEVASSPDRLARFEREPAGHGRQRRAGSCSVD
jgi:serine/threonine protein kinase